MTDILFCDLCQPLHRPIFFFFFAQLYNGLSISSNLAVSVLDNLIDSSQMKQRIISINQFIERHTFYFFYFINVLR